MKKSSIPILLSIISSLGVVATGYFAAKETEKRLIKKNENSEKKEETKVEKILCFSKDYWKALVAGGLTIASITASTVLSKRREANLLAVAGTAVAGWQKYENKVRTVIGDVKNREIKTELAREEAEKKHLASVRNKKLLWYESHCGHFYAKEVDVINALSLINQKISTGMDGDYTCNGNVATLKDFLKDCDAELVDKNLNDAELDFGWELEYLSEMIAEYWVRYYITEDDNKGCKVINFELDPIYQPNNYQDFKCGFLSRNEYFDGKEDELRSKGYIKEIDDELKIYEQNK